MSSCVTASRPFAVCVKTGRLVARCALPTARSIFRSSSVISAELPISPKAPHRSAAAAAARPSAISSSVPFRISSG